MQHFHIMRWCALEIPSGEQITVADTDYASFANEGDARRVSSGVAMQGERCAVVACRSASCTLHGVRSALPTPAFC
jgi:hypothetical protein